MLNCQGVSIATLLLCISGKFVKEIKIKPYYILPNKSFSCSPLPDTLMAIA